MHRAALSRETGTELLHHPVALHEYAPEPVCVLGIVRRVCRVAAERDGAGDFTGDLVDGNGNVELGERLHDGGVEIRDRLRAQRYLPLAAVTDIDVQHMLVEVEQDLERARSVRDGRSGQSLRGDVQGHVPAMIQPWRALQADLADDLRPKLQCAAGITPLPVGQLRPCGTFRGCHIPPQPKRE